MVCWSAALWSAAACCWAPLLLAWWATAATPTIPTPLRRIMSFVPFDPCWSGRDGFELVVELLEDLRGDCRAAHEEAAGPDDRVLEVLRPTVLEQQGQGRGVCRKPLGDRDDILLGEETAQAGQQGCEAGEARIVAVVDFDDRSLAIEVLGDEHDIDETDDPVFDDI